MTERRGEPAESPESRVAVGSDAAGSPASDGGAPLRSRAAGSTDRLATEALCRMLLEQSRSLLSTLDLSGTISYANRAFTKSLGYRVDELIGRNVFDLVHPDDVDVARNAFLRVIEGETVFDFSVRLLDREGQAVHLSASGSLIRDATGRPVAISALAVDLTDQRRVEEELAAERARLAEVLETSDFLHATLDLDGRIVTWNRACEEITRVHRTEAAGRSFFDLLVRWDARDALRARIDALLEGGPASECEGPLPGSRGESRIVSWSFTLRRGHADRVIGFLAVGHETTEGRRAQRETMRARETLENILKSLEEGLFVISAAGETSYWNRRMEEITGLTWAEVINRRAEETFPWLFETGYSHAQEDLLGGRLEAYESTAMRLDTPSGRASVVVRALPYRSADGEISGTIVRIRDVTESLRLRADLAESEARYRNLVACAKDCIHVMDLAGRLVEVNGANLSRGAGLCDASVVLGKRLDEVVEPGSSEAVLRAVERARAGEPVEVDFMTGGGGPALHWNAILAPVRDARGRVQSLLGISRDITDRKHLERELTEKNERLAAALEALERLSRLKDEFLSHASHELRTPLASIRSYAEILRDYPDEEPEVRREFLGIITDECERLTNLLNDLLDLAKIEAGEMTFRTEPRRPEEFVLPAVELSRSLAMRTGIGLEVTIEEGLPEVPIDVDRLEQVMINLLGNAIRHSPPGGTVRVRAGWGGRDGEPGRGTAGVSAPAALRVTVADEGHGIPEEECPLVFDKYFQSKTGRSKRGGTGLGLTICREIVGAMGGEIWVSSRVGAGSTFTFTIPAGRAGAVEAPREAAGETRTEEAAGAPREESGAGCGGAPYLGARAPE